jgi:long-chain acyl-CoA synthetase
MVVFGENKKYAAALIHPDMAYLRDFCNRHGIDLPADDNEVVQLPEIKSIFDREVKKHNQAYAHHEQIKNYALIADEWSVDNGILSPTLKVKRKAVEERYKDRIENLFS